MTWQDGSQGRIVYNVDNEVRISLTFHAMGDDPLEALIRCLEFFDRTKTPSVLPQDLEATVIPR